MSLSGHKPVLGVIAHDYLRTHGMVRIKEDVQLVVIGPPDSRLHELADVSVPVPSLDMSGGELAAVVDAIAARGVGLDGLLAMRDGNVQPVAEVCDARGWRGISLVAANILRSKYTARRWFNDNLPPDLHTPVETTLLEPGLSKSRFLAVLSRALAANRLIFKAARGSCKSFVLRVESPSDFETAWQAYTEARDYRGGAFVIERLVAGREVSVETAVVEGKVVRVLVTDYLPQHRGSLAETGHVAPTSITALQHVAIYALSAALHTGLGIENAVTHTEMFLLDGAPPAIVEVNPRLGGDLIPLLHQYSSGTDLYRVAARAATGLPITADILGEPVPGATALIRFAPPGAGLVRRLNGPASGLSHPLDQGRLLFPAGTRLGEGTTNDDRPAYALVVGEEAVEALDDRAQSILDTLRVAPASAAVQGRRLVDRLRNPFG